MVTTDYTMRSIVAQIDKCQRELIEAFVQGAVYCHCNISERGTIGTRYNFHIFHKNR